MTGCGIMSSVWGMILQWRSTIKVSTELPVATRHRHDMAEKLLEATLNPNKQQQHKGCAHYTGHSRHTNQTLRFDPHVLSSSVLRDREIVGLNPCLYTTSQRARQESSLALHQMYEIE